MEFQNVLLQTSLLKGFANPHLDERILRLVSHFKTHDEQDLPSAKRAAAFCHLSESRFLHLFKKELGLPFRKYLLWLKLRRFFSHLQNGKNITTAAHEAGFSDSSHLSRFFADSFGLNPSEILKNSQFIQVS